MKRLVFVLALLTIAVGCHMHKGIKGSGVTKTEKREVPVFKAVESSGAFDLDITCQKPQSVEIETDENLLSLVELDVKDGILHVGMKQSYNSSHLIKLRIAVQDLNNVTVSGAGNVNVRGIKNDKFELTASGAAKMQIAGETKMVQINNSGAGLIDARELRAARAEVGLSGAGQVHVFASDQLDVTISGVGRVKYSGQPKTVNKNISGIGSISAED